MCSPHPTALEWRHYERESKQRVVATCVPLAEIVCLVCMSGLFVGLPIHYPPQRLHQTSQQPSVFQQPAVSVTLGNDNRQKNRLWAKGSLFSRKKTVLTSLVTFIMSLDCILCNVLFLFDRQWITAAHVTVDVSLFTDLLMICVCGQLWTTTSLMDSVYCMLISTVCLQCGLSCDVFDDR